MFLRAVWIHNLYVICLALTDDVYGGVVLSVFPSLSRSIVSIDGSTYHS